MGFYQVVAGLVNISSKLHFLRKSSHMLASLLNHLIFFIILTKSISPGAENELFCISLISIIQIHKLFLETLGIIQRMT